MDEFLKTLLLFAAFLGHSTSLMPQAADLVYTECGGDVQLSLGEDTYIQYKLDQPYSLDERCIWMFKSDQLSIYTVNVTLISHGFSAGTGVAVYSVDSDRSNLSSYYLPAEILLHPFTFLFFQADDYYSGEGFNVLLQLVLRDERLNPLPKTTVAHISTWHDYYRYPADESNYDINERLNIVINPPNHDEYFRLNIDFMDIEQCGSGDSCTCDRLEVYRINTNGINGYIRQARLCGYLPDGSSHIVASGSVNPMLLLFHSYKNSTTGGGFKLTWEQHQ